MKNIRINIDGPDEGEFYNAALTGVPGRSTERKVYGAVIAYEVAKKLGVIKGGKKKSK